MPHMNQETVEIRFKGKTRWVPGVKIGAKTVILKGTWLKFAEVFDEDVLEGGGMVEPEKFLLELGKSGIRPDIFSFAQRLPDVEPKFGLPYEWDNAAVIRVGTFEDWWESLNQEARKNVRRAAKRGVITKIVSFDDELVRGIHALYNETPIRQGAPFWHFGKDFETVKHELSTYLERSEFIGAYWEEKLIGFIKMVYVDSSARIFHILSSEAHHDKRPTNSLIAKAVEVCAKKGIKYFVYCKYVYGNKASSPLTEFKRRNGFEKVEFPRYFVPLTLKGKLSMKLRLHLGLVGILPESLISLLISLRARVVRYKKCDRRDLRPDSRVENENIATG